MIWRSKLRFFADGPSIPSELLRQRDQGEVVFFCGAGVSMPAGLPSFFKLTKDTIDRLHVSAESVVAKRFGPAVVADNPELSPPLDQIFGLLQKDFGRERVENEVLKLVRVPRGAPTKNHKTIVDLSSDLSGRALVVTTNFDPLFEKIDKKLSVWLPPMLPNLSIDPNASGIVYLHGRVPGRRPGSANYPIVLSSRDFGRAYLADGWATTFMRQLLERRVVVLLGYSAGDPPIRYLLEGLQESTSAKMREIYAFERGEENDVVAKWRDLGAKGISYREHADLWKTLEAWASKVASKSTWNEHILSLAQKSPRDLEPFERGQVAQFISTAEGAKTFAQAAPAPTAEWICIMDQCVRYGRSGTDPWTDGATEVDPFEVYRLDDDPAPLPVGKSTNESRIPNDAVDFLSNLSGDGDRLHQTRMAGIPPTRSPITNRFIWLFIWFVRVAHEPPAIWWVGRQRFLHPELLSQLNRRFSNGCGEHDQTAQRIWSLLLEIFDDPTDGYHDLSWFRFQGRLNAEGWTQSILRLFEKTIRPKLTAEISFGPKPIPPCTNDELAISDCFSLNVKIASRHGENIEIPDEILADVLRALRSALIFGCSLLKSAGLRGDIFRLPAIEPDGRPGERHIDPTGLAPTFLWAVELFERMVNQFPEQAYRESKAWPQSDPYIFDKFRIFAWKFGSIFDPKEVCAGILSMSRHSFWDNYLQREILHLLKARWSDFSNEQREKIEHRITAGDETYEGEDPQNYGLRIVHTAGSWLGWLERNNCEISPTSKGVLQNCRSTEGWRESWELTADFDWDGRGGTVQTITDPGSLLYIPIKDIISEAGRNDEQRDIGSLSQRKSFHGLLKENSLTALSALKFVSLSPEISVKYWEQLLYNWPAEVRPRLTWLCAWRLVSLPDEIFAKLRYSATYWLSQCLASACRERTSDFWKIWDLAFLKLQAAGPSASDSALGDTFSSGGQRINKSRKTMDHAVNAPFGKLTQIIISTMDGRTFQKGDGLPKDVKLRLELARTSVGDGADHAASIIGSYAPFLFYADAKWFKREILPIFCLAHLQSEAAWRGLFFSQQFPQPAFFGLLKADFLSIFRDRRSWLEELIAENESVRILIQVTYHGMRFRNYVSFSECRDALKMLTDNGLQTALWRVRHIVAELQNWRKFGAKFFAEAWPQEQRYQTASATTTLLQIIEENEDEFPQVYDSIIDFIRPIDYIDTYLDGQTRKRDDGQKSLATRWPLKILELTNRITPISPLNAPSKLNSLLQIIADADSSARNTVAWHRLRKIVDADG